MRLFSRVLCVCSLLLLCSCFDMNGKYNLGVAIEINETLENVELFLVPQGQHAGGFLNKRNTSWYMDIKHWVVPEKIKVTFNDEKGQNHDLEIETNLKKNFRGDVLIIINEKNGEYYLTLKTGKLRELAFE